MVGLEIDVTIRITGDDSQIAVKSVIPENKKFIRFRKIKNGYACHISADPNNARKTINEFLESLMFIEQVKKEMDARVG